MLDEKLLPAFADLILLMCCPFVLHLQDSVAATLEPLTTQQTVEDHPTEISGYCCQLHGC
jgi:hypothetical protein